MSHFISRIVEARNNGTVNIYAVCYAHKSKSDNAAVALPGNMDWYLRSNFCNSIICYQECREMSFNPTADGLEDGTYESIPISNILELWNELKHLMDSALNYHGNNRKKVPFSNLYICVLDYNGDRYYLCSKQRDKSDKLLRGKIVLLSQQDELSIKPADEVFLISTYVGFVIAPSEDKILIFDKNAFQDVFQYDDYQKEMVAKKLNIVDSWNFISDTGLIKEKRGQKNVYRNLAKVFADEAYLEQIRQTSASTLKKTLLKRSPENFKEEDFKGDKLIITRKNLDTVMKMLSKGFKYNFFTDAAEQL